MSKPLFYFRVVDAQGLTIETFDDRADALNYAREHKLKVVADEYTYNTSETIEDCAAPPKTFNVVMARVTIEETTVPVVARNDLAALEQARRDHETWELTKWEVVSCHVDCRVAP